MSPEIEMNDYAAGEGDESEMQGFVKVEDDDGRGNGVFDGLLSKEV